MSFTDDFTRELRADLANTLGLPAGAVYLGREPQKVTRQGLEVWVRPAGAEAVGPYLTFHTFEVHVRLKARREGDGTGAEQLEVVRPALDALRLRLDGARPYARAVPTLVAVQADEVDTDRDPSDPDVLDAVLRVKALEGVA
ncbi:MAG: hypothetical protein M9894_33040 [Planctomycetes bacterium]|nr:hypothetical protein [Planctomycetota bacterium]